MGIYKIRGQCRKYFSAKKVGIIIIAAMCFVTLNVYRTGAAIGPYELRINDVVILPSYGEHLSGSPLTEADMKSLKHMGDRSDAAIGPYEQRLNGVVIQTTNTENLADSHLTEQGLESLKHMGDRSDAIVSDELRTNDAVTQASNVEHMANSHLTEVTPESLQHYGNRDMSDDDLLPEQTSAKETQQGKNGRCTYGLQYDSSAFSSKGGVRRVSIITGPDCSWRISNFNPWLTFKGVKDTKGSQRIEYVVTRNKEPGKRIAAITVAGEALVVIQAATEQKGVH